MTDEIKRVEQLLSELKSERTQEVVNALHQIQFTPIGDIGLQQAIKGLFSDRRITIVAVKPTFLFGELSYIAGETLAFEYAKSDIKDNVLIPDTLIPVTAMELYKIANDEEFEQAKGIADEKHLSIVHILSERNKLKRGPVYFTTVRAWGLLKRRGKID